MRTATRYKRIASPPHRVFALCSPFLLRHPAFRFPPPHPPTPVPVPPSLRAAFDAAGQGHVFAFLDAGKLTDEEATALLAQLSSIDVGLVNELFAATMAAPPPGEGSSRLVPVTGVTKLATAPPSDARRWLQGGLASIKDGSTAALILAGGQGTRLGSDRPKGEYDVGLPSHKCLFQLQVERLSRLVAIAGGGPASLPLYVMTSPMTDAETRAFFAAHNNFGYPASKIMFFCQGTLPCLSPTGKIMLESGGKVAEAPDGNGGIYRAAHLSGVVADMAARGVKGTHVFAVDNVVVRAGDPAFLGYCLEKEADVGSKVCPKSGPHERVGVLCTKGGELSVVEYTEMAAADAEAIDPATGELLFNAGNICIHYYSTEFLSNACSPAKLPKVYHLARKAIPCAHPDTGATRTKAEMAELGVNGIKLESFIFDVFPASKSMAVLEIVREEEFSPLKNAPGSKEDSPDTARALISALHRAWLSANGAVLPPAPADPWADAVEVSPLVSYSGENLRALEGVALATPTLVLGADEVLSPLCGLEGEPEEVAPGVAHTVTSAGTHVYRLK